ncbi:MAG TPA: SDR family oxidoreductase [Solirubrobacteraceae bacterium]|nr:SDR family oxidoreductase [Solirubrobacteraceae bacterium]
MSGRVAGKVALITGAARGIGQAQAQRLAEEGADVIAFDVAPLHDTEELVSAYGQRIIAAQVDVTDLGALETAARSAVDELGRLDIVSATAGHVVGLGPAWELTEVDVERTFAVNVFGMWKTIKATVPHVIAAGDGGSIILMSSISGRVGMPGAAHYTATKHAVVGFMRALTKELGPLGIRVNTVNPTNIDTEMFQREVVRRFILPGHPNPTREDVAAVVTPGHALSIPWVDPVDVANAVLWLASDESRYVTGSTFAVDAGAIG